MRGQPASPASPSFPECRRATATARHVLRRALEALGHEPIVADIDEKSFPGEDDVKFRVEYSGINYKDGLAITNTSPVVRLWPMVAGIDGAGVVEESRNVKWKAGDRVILTGFGVGETHWGCLATKAKCKAEWLVRLPAGMSARRAMAIGTAGFTAMLCALAIEKHGVKKGDGDILVTGAAGGVGSVAIAILERWGYRVVASTGRLAETPYLRSLGAAEVIDREALSKPGKPLQKERWAAVVDAVGSHTLVNALAQTRYGGVVAACGLAQNPLHRFVAAAPRIGGVANPVVVHVQAERGCGRVLGQAARFTANLYERKPEAAELLRHRHLQVAGGFQLVEILLEESIPEVVYRRALTTFVEKCLSQNRA